MKNTSNIGETEEQVEREEAMCGKRTSKFDHFDHFDDEDEEVVEQDYGKKNYRWKLSQS